jgi:outer membrane protein assembly factor BamB
VNTQPPFFGGIDLSPRTVRLVTFQGEGMKLDDLYPGIGLRAAWKAALVRPEPAADAPPPAPGDAWPMLLHDPQRSGKSGDTVVPPLKLAWRRTLGGSIHVSSPVIAGQTVYIGLADEENRGQAGVVALDAVTGAEQWYFPTPASIRHTVSVADSLVYAATIDGNLIALNAATGTLNWQYRLGSATERWMYASPVVRGGVLYGGVAPVFVALDAVTGQLVWQAKPMGADWMSCPASPAVGQGMVFAGFNGNIRGFFALDERTGGPRWNNTGREFQQAYAAPSLAGETLYVAANGVIRALTAASGEVKWTFPLAGCGSTPVLAGNTLLVGAADGTIVGLDSATGGKRWSYEKTIPTKFVFAPFQLDGSSILSSPAISGNTAYYGTADGRLLALSTETGRELWSCDVGAPVTASAAVSGNTVFTAAFDGTIYAFTSGR